MDIVFAWEKAKESWQGRLCGGGSIASSPEGTEDWNGRKSIKGRGDSKGKAWWWESRVVQGWKGR
jgi:hypothetical protein